MAPVEWLTLGVILYIITRVLIMIYTRHNDHAKDNAICEKCWGKTMSDDVTESMEWCDCPQRESSDRHFKHHHNECPDCQAGAGCTVCDICAPRVRPYKCSCGNVFDLAVLEVWSDGELYCPKCFAEIRKS